MHFFIPLDDISTSKVPVYIICNFHSDPSSFIVTLNSMFFIIKLNIYWIIYKSLPYKYNISKRHKLVNIYFNHFSVINLYIFLSNSVPNKFSPVNGQSPSNSIRCAVIPVGLYP